MPLSLPLWAASTETDSHEVDDTSNWPTKWPASVLRRRGIYAAAETDAPALLELFQSNTELRKQT